MTKNQTVSEAKQYLSKTTRKLPKTLQQMCLMNVVMYEEKVMRLGYASNVYGYVLGYVKAT